MSDIIEVVGDEPNQYPLPAPPRLLPAVRGAHEVAVRPAVLSDYPFIDALQKANSKAVGFMWEKAIKGHIEKGNVLVAETSSNAREPVGYVIGVDRYLKRDELGVIYQMNVVPELRRSLVAANLLKAKFERSAYGCRLYCCWCAQDLEANRFWEAMGFVPLAFRTGGGRNRKAGPRMHIFWQKRIRQGDTGDPAKGGTPYWFPSQTGAGAIGEDRLVLPIPPGTHWSDAKPIVLPNGPTPAPGSAGNREPSEVKLLENEVQRLERERKTRVKQKKDEAAKRAARAAVPQNTVKRGGLRFGVAPGSASRGASPEAAAAQREAEAAVEAELKAAKKAVKQAKKKFDPAQEAFARELKDRWLEQVAAEPKLIAPAAGSERYDVCRRIGPVPGMRPSEEAIGATMKISVVDEASESHAIPEARRLDAA